MNCKTFAKLLPGYLYDEGTVAEREKLLAHARDCPDCHNLLDEMTATIFFIREEDKSRFSAGEMKAMRMRVNEAIAGMDLNPGHIPVPPRLRFFSRPLFLPAAGALVAASIAAILLFHPAETPRSFVAGPSTAAEELVTMTETVEEEYDSVDELCREMDELQRQFLDEPDGGSEADIGSGRLSFSA